MNEILDDHAIVEQLQRVTLFSGLSDEEGTLELYRVARLVQQAIYQPGEWVFKQGDPADRLYIILEGQVRLYRLDQEGNTIELRTLGPGDWIGETGLLVGDFHDATAEALTPVRLLYLEREPFLELLQRRRTLRTRLKMNREVERRRNLPRYDWLRDDELVIFSVHRHPFFWARRAAPFFIIFAALSAAYLYLLFHLFPRLTSPLIHILDFFFALTTLFIAGILLWHYVNWRDDYFVLTTQRIIHSERVWPHKWSFQEGALRNIQDIHEVRLGILSKLLDFGDLVLQTAGETIHIDLLQVPHPAELRELIFREIERNKAREMLRLREQIHTKLKQRLAPQTVEQPATASETAEPSPRRKLAKGIIAAIRDYFIPPSWEVSADGTTITWRRYWLVGLAKEGVLFATMLVIFLIWVHWGQTQPLLSILMLIIEGGCFFYALWMWEDWHNDYIQITPRRLIVVKRTPLYLKEVRRETTLDRIQDINSNIPGILAKLIKCGTVSLETAGTEGRFQMDWLRHPEKIQAEISKRQETFIRQQQEAEANRRQEEMLNWFATYEAIKQSLHGEQPSKQTQGD